MSTTKKIATIAITSTLITGCTTAQKAFQESRDGKTASVTFVSKSDYFNLAVIHLPGNTSGCSCSNEEIEIIGIFNNKATLMAGSDSYADKGKSVDKFTVKIDANGDEFRFLIPIPEYTFTSASPTISGKLKYCQAHHSFTPKAGGNYTITYDPSVSTCSASISETNNQKEQSATLKSLPLCNISSKGNDFLTKKIIEHCAANPGLYQNR
jgi:hypothetical protein